VLIENLWRSTTFRLSLVYSGLLIAAFAAAAGLSYAGSRAAAETEIRKQIELEAAALVSEIGHEGLGAAIAAIKFREERPGAFEYWVSDGSGTRLAGDLASLEGPNGWRRLDLPPNMAGAENRDSLLVFTQSLPDGVRLSVGDDLDRVFIVQRAIFRTLLSVGVGSVVLGLLAGFAFALSATRRMNRLTAAMSAIAGGDLAARVPVSAQGRRDIDIIGAGVNAMLDRISDLVAGVRRVSRDVAHDLRTPLSQLRQRLEIARAAEGEEKNRQIEAADAKAAQIVAAFDAILRLAEIESGASRSRFAKIDLAGLVDVAVDAWRPDVEDSGRSLHRIGSSQPAVFGDRDLLFQALSNLIENALRHTPVGTVIRVGVIDHPYSCIVVSDNGPGIPAEKTGDAVKAFVRLDPSRTTPGTGLGLSIVEAVAKRHDAQLSLSDAKPGLEATIAFAGAALPNTDGKGRRSLARSSTVHDDLELPRNLKEGRRP